MKFLACTLAAAAALQITGEFRPARDRSEFTLTPDQEMTLQQTKEILREHEIAQAQQALADQQHQQLVELCRAVALQADLLQQRCRPVLRAPAPPADRLQKLWGELVKHLYQQLDPIWQDLQTPKRWRPEDLPALENLEAEARRAVERSAGAQHLDEDSVESALAAVHALVDQFCEVKARTATLEALLRTLRPRMHARLLELKLELEEVQGESAAEPHLQGYAQAVQAAQGAVSAMDRAPSAATAQNAINLVAEAEQTLANRPYFGC